MPCTAAITGFHTLLARGDRARPGSSSFQMFSGRSRPSPTSMPVQNALSPAARRTATWMSSSRRTRAQISGNSASIRRLNALSASGRLSVMVATWSATSNSTVLYGIWRLPLPAWFARHAERTLGDDVLQHFGGPARDGVGAGVEEGVLPPSPGHGRRIPLGEDGVRALQAH